MITFRNDSKSVLEHCWQLLFFGKLSYICIQLNSIWEKEMATHSSILAWRILWTEEPGGLLSMGSHRARHDWSDLACMHALKKEMATHASILAWRIPGTEEPGGLPSMGSHRVGHDGSNLAAAAVTEFDKQFLHAQYCVDSYKRHRRNTWSRHFPQEASNQDKETKWTHFPQKTHETRSSGYKMSPSTGYQTCNGALSLPRSVIHGKSCNLSEPVSSIWEILSSKMIGRTEDPEQSETGHNLTKASDRGQGLSWTPSKWWGVGKWHVWYKSMFWLQFNRYWEDHLTTSKVTNVTKI